MEKLPETRIQALRDLGFEDDEIAAAEALGFADDAVALRTHEFSRALLRVLTRRLGADFASEVQAELLNRVDRHKATGKPKRIVAGALGRNFARSAFWERLIGKGGY